MIGAWIDVLKELLADNLLIGLLIAFALGVLTFLMPCTLGSVSMILGYVGGTNATKKKAFVYSLVFTIGQVVVLAVIGFALFLVFDLSEVFLPWPAQAILNWLLGLFMFVLVLDIWGVISIFPKGKSGNNDG